MNQTTAKTWHERGVIMPDPQQVSIDATVKPERVEAGVVLHPGVRLLGEQTLLGKGTELGTEGSTVVNNCALGRNVKLASGSFSHGVFLDGSSWGPSGQVRDGTLVEEGASAAHASGAKQTILMPWATLGSNINCCDALLAGGTSRSDHSEIGSGFIHFNFTPFGPKGDKATPSLFGDVVRGVWLNESRIFLGGAGGVVGPIRIGYGTVLAAGSVYRKDRGEDLLVYAENLPGRAVSFDASALRRSEDRCGRNLDYLAELLALRAWYQEVRLPFAEGDTHTTGLMHSAIALLNRAVEERLKQLDRFIQGFPVSADHLDATGQESEAATQRRLFGQWSSVHPKLRECKQLGGKELQTLLTTQQAARAQGSSFVAWVQQLSEEHRVAGAHWLRSERERWRSHPQGAGLLVPTSS